MTTADGVHEVVSREQMTPGARRIRETYERVPGASLYRREFGYYVMERMIREGHLTEDTDLTELIMFDPSGIHNLGQLGWCEAAAIPPYETCGDCKLCHDCQRIQVSFVSSR
jgi:hypothetical protein